MVSSTTPRRFCLRLLTALLSFMAALAQAQTRTEQVEGEVIVTFKATATRRSAESALERRSLRFERHFPELSALRRKPMGLVRKLGRKTQDLIQELKADPTVETVEPNYLRWVKATPNDTRFNELWALRNTGQTVDGFKGTSGADIKYLDAWDKARPPIGEMVVAVIDTGVDVLHPELAPRMWVNTQETPNNNLDDDGNGYKDDYHGYDFADDLPDPSDSGDHGTHVAGTIAAQGNNSLGLIGIHDQVRIMALKVSNDGDAISSSGVIEAVEYAVAMKRRGVPIVALNASYGGGGFSTAEKDSIASAGAEGIIMCAAAGNEGANNNLTPSYPASYDLANIITVASTDARDALSGFSNFGSTSVDIAAPGSSILSTEPSKFTVNIGSSSYETLPMTFGGVTTGLSGKVYDCGIGNPGEFPSGVSGNIALIARGTLTFAEKVTHAKAAGATAAIIYNNVDGLFLGTLGTAGDWIPARAISRADGLAIKALALPVNASIVMSSGYQFLDGTSMATPHVTGAVAFAALNFPNETVSQRVARILNNVDVKTSLQGKVRTGGRLNLNRIVDTNQDGIADWLASAIAITNGNALKGGVVGAAYAETLVTNQGSAPFTFSVSQGSLPPGLTLSTAGVLDGQPTQAGSFSFTVLVNDSAQNNGGKNFTLVIAATAPSITTVDPLPEGSTGAPYTATLAGSGGTAPYTWTLLSGSLPTSFTLSSAGVLSGVPADAATSTFTVRLVDAHQLIAEKELHLTVALSPITITTGSPLPYGMRAEPYAQSLIAEGGQAPYTWSIGSGSLPPGLQLSTTGLLQGKPTTAGNYTFRAQLSDDNDLITSKTFSLEIRSVFLLPVMNALALDSTFVGAPYTATLNAQNYPKSFTLKGLPKGLTYSPKTGIISGRPQVSGDFTLTATASNPAGRSAEVTGHLFVRSLDPEWIGSFAGTIAPDPEAGRHLGSRFTLTTTALGSYTVKVTTGATTKSAVGFLSEAAPQISVPVDSLLLTLTLDGTAQLISGTHGSATASVSGWRNPWHTKNLPATDHAAYYSAALNLTEPGDQGQAAIPQGTGYLTARISAAGIVSIAGRTAAGDTVTSSFGLGPDGQAGVYQSLYKHKGSLLGNFTVSLSGESAPLGNSLTGSLSWLKPLDTSRTYGAGFGPLKLSLVGGYLAPKSAGSIVQGLPQPGNPALIFTDGGLALSDTDPNVTSFEYSSTYVVKMPLAGSSGNPARATLVINKATGTVTGSFTLAELDSTLKRKASFLGMIVPQPSGEVKAQGYFLLPQLPLDGQKATTTPILSGGMQVLQTLPPD